MMAQEVKETGSDLSGFRALTAENTERVAQGIYDDHQVVEALSDMAGDLRRAQRSFLRGVARSASKELDGDYGVTRDGQGRMVVARKTPGPWAFAGRVLGLGGFDMNDVVYAQHGLLEGHSGDETVRRRAMEGSQGYVSAVAGLLEGSGLELNGGMRMSVTNGSGPDVSRPITDLISLYGKGDAGGACRHAYRSSPGDASSDAGLKPLEI